MTVAVAVEHPSARGVADLVREGDAHGLSLYPAESYYALDLASLADPEVRLFVARREGVAVGIAALVLAAPGGETPEAELKRMFVAPAARGAGVATALLTTLERTAVDLGVSRLVLETGPRQPEAIALYEKHGYVRIPNFGPYINDPLSLCFAKDLSDRRSRQPSTR
ncbi:GNAT family N-acetyltransferase [Lysobacter korlensis]|uniref:GNAT family N-acetyltransferase n=1 Tax=Lysobacter korlensis TaxID=553636 RepID=A0ABV6RX58_9GAMM